MATTVTPESAAAPANGAAPASNTTGTPPAGAGSQDNPRFNPDEIIDEMIEEKGGGMQGARLAAKKLLRDKGKLLEKVSRLRARVVEEGAIVLKGDDAAAYTRFRALELTPEQMAAIKKERDELSGEVSKTKRVGFLEQVAGALDLPSKEGRAAFADLAESKKLDIVMRDVEQEDGEGTVAKPFARRSASEEYQPLESLLKKSFEVYLPALYAEEKAGNAGGTRRTDGSGSSRGHAQSERKVTPMATQSGSSRQTTAPPDELSAADDALAAKYDPKKKEGSK